MSISDPLLTVRECAAYLQISVPTFWRRVADGTIPRPVKIGGLSRWPKSEIATVIEQAKAQRYEEMHGDRCQSSSSNLVGHDEG